MDANFKTDAMSGNNFPKQMYCLKLTIENFRGRCQHINFESLYEVGKNWKFTLSKSDNYIDHFDIFIIDIFRNATVDGKIIFARQNGEVFIDHEVYKIKGEDSFRLLTDFEIPNNLGVTEKTVEITVLLKKHEEMEDPAFESFKSESEFRTLIQDSVMEDLEKLYESHVNSDVSLFVAGETLDVHKAILSARSPVFSAMFQQEMAETRSNIVVIEDATMATMKEVVAFMYGKARRDYDSDTAMEMYYLADKYDVKKLKEICRDILATQVDERNVGDILNLSDRHHEPVLKQSALTFINSNLRSCVITEWWGRLMSKKTDLSVEVAKYVLDNM